ncbi:protein tyrosine phosphatase domain-containing protein 1 [Aplochiton taeniatus]
MSVPVPRPSYSQAREMLVKAIPPNIICLLGCGGRDCRYEGPACWRTNQQAIKGLFSSWVTDDILAMARPSTNLIKTFKIIEQFKQLNIKSIINMQFPGEHGHCGPPLERDSGFTYSPQTFMENEIFFFNFGMADFGVSSLVSIIDGVKVLSFAVNEGKVAIHCHAGLGRTGVLIACYLVYTLRISPSEAIHYVRAQRQRSIQTRAQISLVFDFARLVNSQLNQYPDLNLRHGAPFTLQHYLNRQALLLHGQEARTLRDTPKVVYLLCLRLSCLALGLPAPPEVQAELERRTRLRALASAVRETLMAKRYLPLLQEGLGHPSTESGSYWDEAEGFLKRKREVLRDKRSYSHSDLSKIKNMNLGLHCPAVPQTEKDSTRQDRTTLTTKELKTADSDIFIRPTTALGHYNSKEHSKRLNLPAANGPVNKPYPKKSKNPAKKTQVKFGSTMELRRNHRKSTGQASVARAVARAMADPNPPGEAILQRASLLQDELNSSECAWALLVTESDSNVLSCLLWVWLERLRDPVLSAEDIEKMTTKAQQINHLSVLLKPKRKTITCLLRCVGQVTSLCPQREDAVLRRLIRALTRRPQEELQSHTALMKVLKSNLREIHYYFLNRPSISYVSS